MMHRVLGRRAVILCILLAYGRPVLGEPIQNGGPEKTEPAGEWTESSLRVGSLERWFRVYRPRELPEHPPAVLLLHGGTQSMRKIFALRAGGTRAWTRVCDREGAVLIVPNGVNPQTGDTRGDNQNWNDLRSSKSDRHSTADDVSFIVQLLDEMVRSHGLDKGRIYVTGVSNGGMLTYRLLIEAPERFAAGAAFIALLPSDLRGLEPPSKPTPLLILNGTEDPLVRWEGGPIRGQTEKLMSAESHRDWWIRANRAQETGVREEALPDVSPDDGCRIYRTFHPAQTGGAPVLFLKVQGGGHALPSRTHTLPDNAMVRRLIGPVCRDAEGAELAWEFMSRYQR